jgi:regulator of protease activity HflC (stomatin/prohibitin superfamily)
MKTLATVAFIAAAMSGCTAVKVDPGNVGVTIESPWLFGHGGVDEQTVFPGLSYAAVTTDYVEIPVIPMTVDEYFKDAMPKDNNPIEYHAALRFQVTDAVKIVKNFGYKWHDMGGGVWLPEWYARSVQRTFQTMNRDQVRNYSMPELALTNEVVAKVEADLTTQLTAYVDKIGLPVKILGVTLGKISPSESILHAYNETGVQQQRAKTEHQRKLAEDARKEAEVSRAIADRAYQDSMGMNTDQYIRLQTVKMCADKQNCSVFLGANPQPFVTGK